MPAAVYSRGRAGMTLTMQSNPDSIIWRLHLRSSPQRVYDMLATNAGRACFWAESAEERDGAIHFRFINGVTTVGEILERNPPRRFALEYFGSRVVFDLADDSAGGTDLTMTNTGYAPKDRDEILPGWLNVLLPLKAAADFGIDLRSHDPQRSWNQRFVDQ